MLPFTLSAQTFEKLFSELKVDAYQFSSKYIDGVEVSDGFWGSTIQKIPIEGNDFFSDIELQYDELKELESMTYNILNKKRKEKTSQVFDLLVKHLGDKYDVFDETYDREVHYTWKINNFEVFLNNPTKNYGNAYLRIRPILNIKPLERYDEFDKKTYISLINYRDWLPSEEGGIYIMNFRGIKESHSIYMLISTKSRDWKFIENIELLIDGGDVIKLPLETIRDVSEGRLSGVLTNETGITELTEELSKRIIDANIVKMRVNGEKSTGVVTFSDQTKSALSIVYNKVL